MNIDNYIINNEKLDRRVKLTKEQKEMIKKEYVPYSQQTKSNYTNIGSMNWLAAKYGVSRRLISSIVRDKPIKQVAYCEKKDYPTSTTGYRTQKTKEHRQYKEMLLYQGKI